MTILIDASQRHSVQIASGWRPTMGTPVVLDFLLSPHSHQVSSEICIKVRSDNTHKLDSQKLTVKYHVPKNGMYKMFEGKNKPSNHPAGVKTWTLFFNCNFLEVNGLKQRPQPARHVATYQHLMHSWWYRVSDFRGGFVKFVNCNLVGSCLIFFHYRKN